MKRTKRPIRLVFIDDEADNRQQLVELASSAWPTWKISAVETALEATSKMPDVAVFDVSAISPLQHGQHSYGVIATFMDRCPGASIVITSAASANFTNEILDDVEKQTGRRPTYGGWGPWENLKPAIEKASAGE